VSPAPQPLYPPLQNDLLACAARGEVFDAKGSTIQAAFIADLCSGRPEATIHPRGVRVKNACLDGLLDLDGATVANPLYLIDSKIPNGVTIQDAVIRTFVLEGSSVGSIAGRRVTVGGLLNLNRCSLGSVALHDARIQGSVAAEGARLRSTEEFGFAADRIAVTGSLFLRKGFRCSSGITLVDCEIGGSLDLTESALRRPGKAVIRGYRASIGGGALFSHARIRGEIQLGAAHIGGSMEFVGSRLRNPRGRTLNLEGVRTGVAILFWQGFMSCGQIRLAFADVGGNVEFDNATLIQESAPSPDPPCCLHAHGLRTKSHVRIIASKCTGQIILARAGIGGDLTIRKSEFWTAGARPVNGSGGGELFVATGANISGEATFISSSFGGQILLAQSGIGLSLGFQGGSINTHAKANFSFLGSDATIGGAVYFSDGFTTNGGIRFTRADITGQVSLISCTAKRFEMDGAKVHGGLSAGGKGTVQEGLSLAGSEIDGPVTMDEVTVFQGVNFARANLKSSLKLTSKFDCRGEFSLVSARILGSLIAESTSLALFIGPEKADRKDIPGSGVALRGDGAQVQGDINFRHADIVGTVRFRNADVSGDLDFAGAKISAWHGRALRLTGARVGGGLYLRNGFTTDGAIRLARARVNGILDFTASVIGPADPPLLAPLMAIDAQGLDVQGVMILRALGKRSAGTVSFNNARIGRLVDDWRSWKQFHYRIDGLEFKVVEQSRTLRVSRDEGEPSKTEGPMTLRQRIEWLHDQQDWNVQPYEHIARVFRDGGFEADAQKVLIRKSQHLREKGGLTRSATVKNWLLDHLLSYGYNPWRSLIPMALMLLIGFWVFQSALTAHALIPKDKTDKTEFNRFAYSLDAFIPLVNLKQREAFVYVRPSNLSSGQFVFFQTYFWVHTGLGWILTTVAAAGLTGLIKKE